MKTPNCQTSACRYCRHYLSEGRRGGTCELLNVPVCSNWKACSMAAAPFESPWENMESISLLEKSFAMA